MSGTAPPLVLASGSPRRRELLEESGYRFKVIRPEVEEDEDVSRPIRALTQENADLKCRWVAERHPEAAVIAADTLVLLGERVLTKPADRDEATAMLADLNGMSHQVFTAVSVVQLSSGRRRSFSVTTDVHFRNLTVAEMADYHERIDPMDKAGAYAAQEHGDRIIDRIEGSMTNVIGLPMDEVENVLREDFGIVPDDR